MTGTQSHPIATLRGADRDALDAGGTFLLSELVERFVWPGGRPSWRRVLNAIWSERRGPMQALGAAAAAD